MSDWLDQPGERIDHLNLTLFQSDTSRGQSKIPVMLFLTDGENASKKCQEE